ncbi:MAG TPA: type II toxin-antitoxin system death-on-curing family toxin [Phycisphaerales bacterium]|nr:type II toxin-antitoxin system death-on-curing family toxin [Phycisphaerales bacterium]
MIFRPRFLTVDDVLRLHVIAIQDQGGDPTVRDLKLLESAVAQPAQVFEGQFLHADIPEMAAAYAFHICKNHPFIDGNKRAGVAAMIAFLSDNGWKFEAHVDEAEAAILQLASSPLSKQAFTEWLRKHIREKPKMELREFFAQLSKANIDDVVESVVAGGKEIEAKATTEEAMHAIPLVRELNLLIDVAKQANQQDAYHCFNGMLMLVVGIHRTAEDMGDEW